jgi:hypothetical protein
MTYKFFIGIVRNAKIKSMVCVRGPVHTTSESVTRKMDRIHVEYKISESIATETLKIFYDKTESEAPLV